MSDVAKSRQSGRRVRADRSTRATAERSMQVSAESSDDRRVTSTRGQGDRAGKTIKRERSGLNASVGENVRRERQRARMSLRDLARRIGVSPAFLSQFELGQSQAAVNTLFAIATELNLSIDALLGHSVSPSTDDKSGRRGVDMELSDYLAFQAGVRWRRLAQLDGEQVDFLLTEYEPGADSAPNDGPQRHKGNDYGYVLEGTLTVVLNGRRRQMRAGEAIAMRGDEPHQLRNETDQIVRAIWCVIG